MTKWEKETKNMQSCIQFVCFDKIENDVKLTLFHVEVLLYVADWRMDKHKQQNMQKWENDHFSLFALVVIFTECKQRLDKLLSLLVYVCIVHG